MIRAESNHEVTKPIGVGFDSPVSLLHQKMILFFHTRFSSLLSPRTNPDLYQSLPRPLGLHILLEVVISTTSSIIVLYIRVLSNNTLNITKG